MLSFRSSKIFALDFILKGLVMKKSDIDWSKVQKFEENEQEVTLKLECKRSEVTVEKKVNIKYQILQYKNFYIRVLLKPFYVESDLTSTRPNIDNVITFLQSQLLAKYKNIALRNKQNKAFYNTLEVDDKKSINILYHHAKIDQYKGKNLGNFWLGKSKQEYKISDLTKSDFENFLSLERFVEILTHDNCAYCNISIANILELSQNALYTKRARGYAMEVDQKDPLQSYSDENCVACCYWCNNAKTDEFSASEFKEIARGINKVWRDRGIDIEFQENSPIWNK